MRRIAVLAEADLRRLVPLDLDAIARADLYVPDSLAQARVLGELRHAVAAKLVAKLVAELVAVVAGRAAAAGDGAVIQT